MILASMQHRIFVSSRKISQLKHSSSLFCIWSTINEWDSPYLIHQLNICRSLFARYNSCYLQKQHRWKQWTSMKLYSIWRIVVFDRNYLTIIVCVYLSVSHHFSEDLLPEQRMKDRMLPLTDSMLLCKYLAPVEPHIDPQMWRIFWSRLLH